MHFHYVPFPGTTVHRGMLAMSIVAEPVHCSTGCANRTNGNRDVQDRVLDVVSLYRTRPACGDRRCDRREPFPYPIHVTPVSGHGEVLSDETFVVLGKHLSERGLDFYHNAPLPYRRVITSWECRDGSWLALMLDLRWCRSTRHGWYENGGRFVQAVPSPLGSAPPAIEVESITDNCESELSE